MGREKGHKVVQRKDERESRKSWDCKNEPGPVSVFTASNFDKVVPFVSNGPEWKERLRD